MGGKAGQCTNYLVSLASPFAPSGGRVWSIALEQLPEYSAVQSDLRPRNFHMIIHTIAMMSIIIYNHAHARSCV